MIPVFVGVAAVALTLVAGNRLIHPDPDPTPDQNRGNGSHPGPTVLGTVCAAGPLVPYGLPETLQSGRVRKIVDENYDGEIKPGQVLIEFDDTLARRDLDKAEAGWLAAGVKVLQAKLREALYPFDLALQELAVKGATEEYASAFDALTRGRDKLERVLAGTNFSKDRPYTEDEKKNERRDNLDLMKGEAAVRLLAIKLEAEKKKLEKVQSLKPALLVQEAEADVAVRAADVAKAKYAVEACVVKANAAGRLARVDAAGGSIIYPQNPPILIVPSGTRYVRAEVEPEFAYKLAGSEGKSVVISDNNNFNLTYPGTVKRIGTAFLPKRNQGLAALASPTPAVLEVVIEVTDANPSGKPPLLVGQPVRISFP
jgi:multidrug resistance efflux pump